MSAATRALARREFFVLLPWLLFMVATHLVVLVQSVVDENAPLALLGWARDGTDRVFGFSLWFVVGARIGDHDVRRGTESFLNTLPVSPQLRFAVRAATVCALATAMAALGELPTVVALLRLDDPTDLGAALLSVGVGVACYALRDIATVLLGLAFAPLRQLTWLLAASFGLAVALANSDDPRLGPLLPTYAAIPVEVGGTWRVEAIGPFVLFGVATAALLVGARAGAPRRGIRWLPALTPRLVRFVWPLTLVVFFGLWQMAWSAVSPAPVEELRTRHFVFRARSTAAIDGDVLDNDVDALQREFATQLKGPMRAHVTHRLAGAHGAARGTLMAIKSINDRFVVAHEVAHVLAHEVSGGAMATAKLEVFGEGLASHMARRVVDGPSVADEHKDPMARLVPHAATFDDSWFYDADALRARGGGVLVYAVGELFVDAMVDVYGKDAPLRVLRAVGERKGARLRAELALLDAVARSDLHIGAIRTRFYERLSAAAAQAEATRTTPPRPPLAHAQIEGRTLVVSGVDEFGVAVDVTCAVRDHPYIHEYDTHDTCRVPLVELAGPTAEVRVSRGPYVHSAWTRVPLPRR